MTLHENRLPADDYHEISCLIGYFLKSGKILNCRLLRIIGGALRVNIAFVCSTEPFRSDFSFEYPQHMFWLRNKKNNF